MVRSNNKPSFAKKMNSGTHHGVGTPLLKVQIHCWPPPHLSIGLAKKLHLQLIDELRRALDPVQAKGPSCGYGPRYAAPTRGESAASQPNCWLDSSTIRSCLVDGNETICRVDHYICDDGSWYDEEIPLAVEAADGGDGGGNGLAGAMNGEPKAPQRGSGGRPSRQKSRSA